MNTGKFIQTLHRVRQKFPQICREKSKLTLNPTTILNFNTKTSAILMLQPQPLMRHGELHNTMASISPS